MNVGLATLRFRLYSVDSIKEKRSIVKRLLADVRRRGPSFAACEGMDQDDLRRLTICVAHLSNDSRFTESVLARLVADFERGDGYEMTESRIEPR
jgi:uncharacterized protein YlxP (DUF503 family)